jgi:CarD family transcriptional regulator
MFEIGSYVVCPGHGVGQVTNIEVKQLGDEEQSFYVIKVITNGMTVMVPSGNKSGIRELISVNEISEVFTLLQNHQVKVDNSTWNRRHREYMQKVKTGSLLEIADVLRSLFLLKTTKKLSFGERKMLDQCKELIVKEIAISTGGIEKEIDVRIDSIFEQ